MRFEGQNAYTGVTFRAYDEDGKCVQKQSNGTCFGPLNQYYALVKGPSYYARTSKPFVKVEYTPTVSPFKEIAKPAGVIPDFRTKIPKWVDAINMMVGENLYTHDNGDIVYTVPKDANLLLIKFHLFLMRQAFNHPLVLCYFDALIKDDYTPENLWNAIAFLSSLPHKKWWKGRYDDVHSLYGGEGYNVAINKKLYPFEEAYGKLKKPDTYSVIYTICNADKTSSMKLQQFFRPNEKGDSLGGFPYVESGGPEFITKTLKPKFEEFKELISK